MPLLRGYAAMHFDLSYARAARITRLLDVRDNVQGQESDPTGAGAVFQAMLNEHLRA